jgi:hypothetical protein
MDFSKIRADMLPELFQKAKAMPRKMLAFESSDGIRFEADLHVCGDNKFLLHVCVRADQFDDDVRCDDRETGEDWVRKALEGSGLEFVEETPATFGEDHWEFSRVYSTAFFGERWGEETTFWEAALDELKRAQAMHACKCGKALTTADVCPVCWTEAVAADAAAVAADGVALECPGAPLKKRRSGRT